MKAGRGLIDPCPLWDDDGKACLAHAYAHSRSGLKHKLRICPLAADGSRLLDEGQIVFDQPDRHHTIEGPKFLKREGWYYILAPAGGVATGWQTCLRSRNIFGPYEDRIVLEQGNTPVNGPHEGGLVATPDDEWWFLHFQDAGVYGRVVHLQPIEWQDGWPLMGREGGGMRVPVLHYRKPVVGVGSVTAVPQANDEFTSSKLGLQWQWYANHKEEWHSLVGRPGWLRLFAQPVLGKSPSQTPHLLLQKFPARAFDVETFMEFAPAQDGDEAGLAVTGNMTAALVLRAKGRTNQLVFRAGGGEQVIAASLVGGVKIRVAVAEGGLCTFKIVDPDGKQTMAGEFQACAGRWIGAKIGIFCSQTAGISAGGFADFDYFRFTNGQ